MAGFSGASGVPKKYVDDLVAQSTAKTVTKTTPATGITVYDDGYMAMVVINASVTVTSTASWLDISSNIPRVHSNDQVLFVCLRTDTHDPILARCSMGSLAIEPYQTGTYTIRGTVTYFRQR